MTSNPSPLAAALVRWCLETGVDYRELAELLKHLYLEAGKAKLVESGAKVNDSALSLLTGLHRKEIRQARELAAAERDQSTLERQYAFQNVSLPAQLVASWLTQDLPRRLTWLGTAPNFHSLAQSVSRDVHPKALLNTLELQGVVSVDPQDGSVRLLHDSYTPSSQTQAMLSLLSNSVADHLEAGLGNLSLPADKRHLEQSVFADGLTAESADELERLASRLWSESLQTLLHKATALCNQDENQGGTWRFRIGMYSYSTTAALVVNPENQNRPLSELDT